jgi:citrate lyase subunit beta/citryl-CoA lyase
MVTTDFGDEDRFLAEADEARTLGFAGKLCIHPAQVPLAHRGFRPSDDEVAWAARVVEAWETATARGCWPPPSDGRSQLTELAAE